mgnify:CR=1 FL=1
MTTLKRRPEHVVCIRKEKTKEGICGRYLGFEFAFVNMDHAKATEASDGRLVLCEDCRKSHGTEVEDS